MGLFTTIVADRYAQGRLWTPELSLDMLGNHWSQLSGTFDLGFPEVSEVNPPGGLTWNDLLPLNVGYPEDYALDTTFDDMQVEVGVIIEAKRANTNNNMQLRLELSGATGTAVTVSATSYTEYTLTFTGAGTGLTELQIQHWFSDSSSNTAFARRTFGDGLKGYIKVELT